MYLQATVTSVGKMENSGGITFGIQYRGEQCVHRAGMKTAESCFTAFALLLFAFQKSHADRERLSGVINTEIITLTTLITAPFYALVGWESNFDPQMCIFSFESRSCAEDKVYICICTFPAAERWLFSRDVVLNVLQELPLLC